MNTVATQLRTRAMAILFSVLCAFTVAACASDPHGRTVGTEVDDAWITSKVKSSLMADDLVNSFAIEVDTHRNHVMLSGFVETQNQIDRAVEIAKKTEGVKKVINNLEKKPRAMSQSNQ